MALRRLLTAAHAAHHHAAPASTLLLVTLALLLLTRFTFAAEPDGWRPVASARPDAGAALQAWITPVAEPGGRIEIALDARADARFDAYLPGLDPQRVLLRYDAETGHHRGQLTVPGEAPARGWCTLRLVGEDAREWDVRVALGVPLDEV